MAISPDASNAPPTASSPVDSGDDLEIQFKLAPDTLKQGKELEQQGKYPEAIGLYTQVIQNDQKNLLAWWGLGNIYFRLGRRDYAAHCFEEVLKINPKMAGLAEWLKKYKSASPARPVNP
jgi:tetratricopeptide (TPR) repeat protein